jgi:outer membrane protein
MLNKHPILTVVAALALIFSSGSRVPGAEPPPGNVPLYALTDLYALALGRSEQIEFSRQDIRLAETTRQKAFSVLVPRFSTFGDYTRYNENSLSLPDSSTTWGLRLDQSFTLNGKELIALRITDEQIAKSRHDLDAVREAYLYQVAAGFYGLLVAEEAFEIARTEVTRLQTHLDSVRMRLKLEEVAKTALYRAEAELSKAITARTTASNLQRLAANGLARLVGLGGAYQVRSPRLSAVDPVTLYDLERLKQEALATRPELKSLEVQQQIAANRVEFARSAYWPTVSLSGQYTDGRMEPEDLYVTEESYSIGAQLTFTLFDGGLRKADIREARIQKRQAALARADLEKTIALEVETVYLELLNQQSVLQSLDDQLQFAQANYDAVAKQFEHGLANSTDVMDANTLLVTSQRQLSEARYGHQLALLKLERVKGIFLPNILQRITVDGQTPVYSGENTE